MIRTATSTPLVRPLVCDPRTTSLGTARHEGQRCPQRFRSAAKTGFGLVAAWAWAAILGLGVGSEPAVADSGMRESFVLSTGLSAEAASKMDPRLVLAKAMPRDEGLLRRMGQRIPMFGASAHDISYPVVILSKLTDAELAALGAKPDSRVGDLITARVAERDLNALGSHPEVIAIEAGYWLASTLDVSIPEIRANQVNQPGGGGTGQGVLYGLIDDGLDLTHDDFKNAQGQTRVQFVWDHFATGSPPTGFNYGREYTRAQINNGQANAFTNEGGHGSHVAGISVGDGSGGNTGFRGVAWEADIAVVRNGFCDLFCYGGGNPAWGQESTIGAIDGVRYLKQKATSLGMPLVINQSQGVMMGPHDGTTLFEKAYNQLITQQNIIIAVAAGNDQVARWHGRQNVTANGSSTFALTHDTSQQAGGPLGSVSFELWYDQGRQFSYQVITPSGGQLEIPASTGNEAPGTVTAHSDSVFFYSATANPINQQGTLDIFILNRTSGVEGGSWQVRVNSQSGSAGNVDLYCERNQDNFTVNNPNLSAIVAMPGTATEVITVGSYNTRFNWPNASGGGQSSDGPNPLGEITTFSSNGPRRDGAQTPGGQKPDLAAPGKWIVSSLASVHQTNPTFITPDGRHHALLGTSMACPHVAGAIAIMLQRDPTLTHTQVKQILQQTARKDVFTGQNWAPDFGHGKLDVRAAVDAVGGGSSCPTTRGDANLNGTVNVLDVVAMVNHILGSTPLAKDAIACADVVADQQITIRDVNGAVGVILAGAPRPLPTLTEPVALAWGESVESTRYQLTLAAETLGGIQLSFILPRGYQLNGDPVLEHARSEANLAWSEALGQYTLIAYDPFGRPLAGGPVPLTVEIPFLETWDGGQSAEDFSVTRMILSDPVGAALALEPEPSLEPAAGTEMTGGLRDLLEAMSPNPLVRVTQIAYRTESSGGVRLDIFDPSGRRVRSLWDGHQMAGGHSVPWDGRNDHGAEVADGVYFVRLQSGGNADTEKILVVR